MLNACTLNILDSFLEKVTVDGTLTTLDPFQENANIFTLQQQAIQLFKDAKKRIQSQFTSRVRSIITRGHSSNSNAHINQLNRRLKDITIFPPIDIGMMKDPHNCFNILLVFNWICDSLLIPGSSSNDHDKSNLLLWGVSRSGKTRISQVIKYLFDGSNFDLNPDSKTTLQQAKALTLHTDEISTRSCR